MKLHLGCGRRRLPGFVHVDEADYPHIDHKHTIAELPFIEDGTAELIYASHAFEYFDRQKGAEVLKEWYRVLKKGGILRLAVPDFKSLCEIYTDKRELDLILGPLYGRMKIKSNAMPKTIYHQTVYDEASLSRVLQQAGFRSVRRYDWQQTLHKDHDDHSQAYIPHMDKAKGKLISLNVEAVK